MKMSHKETLMRKLIILFFSLFLFNLSLAGQEDKLGPLENAQHTPPGLTQNGKLINIKIVPGDKQLKIYLIGKDVGGLEVNKGSLEAYLQFGQQEKRIELSKKQDYYLLDQQPKGSMRIEFRSSDQKQKEDFHFKLD